jgi:hypothetical protein
MPASGVRGVLLSCTLAADAGTRWSESPTNTGRFTYPAQNGCLLLPVGGHVETMAPGKAIPLPFS